MRFTSLLSFPIWLVYLFFEISITQSVYLEGKIYGKTLNFSRKLLISIFHLKTLLDKKEEEILFIFKCYDGKTLALDL